MAENNRTTKVTKKEVTITLPVVHTPKWLEGFVDFVRSQGVVGLAVGLILGVAAKGLIDSLVANIFNPLIGMLTGGVSLEDKTWCVSNGAHGVCQTAINYGQFISDAISFLIVVATVYFVVKGLKLDRLDKKVTKNFEV